MALAARKVTIQYQSGAGQPAAIPVSVAPGDAIERDVNVPASTTNKEVPLAFDLTGMLGLVIWADGDLTVKTNDSGSPDDTLAFKAGRPLVWLKDTPAANPFTADVTTLFLTNASSTTAVVLYVRILLP
jgi:hypothetical protein